MNHNGSESVECNDPIDALEFDEKTGKRATHEAFSFDPGAGIVTVRNESYGAEADEHAYRVDLDARGVPTRCSCPADEYHPGACKHRVAVALADPVREAATPMPVPDGGEIIEAGDDGVLLDERPDDCTCLPGSDLPCWPCYHAGFETVNVNATLEEVGDA